MDRFNLELQQVWDRLLPDLTAQLQAQGQALQGSLYSRGAIDIEVVNVQTTQSQMAIAPGLTSLSHDRVDLRLPRQGGWELILEADIRVQITITGSIAPAVNIPVKITISDLSAEIEVEFDQSDPTRPVLTRAGQPNIQFNVRIDSSSSLLNQVTPVLTPIANALAHYALNNALGGVLPALSGLQGLPGPVPGLPAVPYTDSGTPVPFEQIMTAIDAKIRANHLPFGTLLGAVMSVPQLNSWEDAYAPGGTGLAGTTDRWTSGGDSAIFTGQYLASQAFRYAATGDPAAMDNLQHTLGGIGKLLDVNAGSGLLARCAAPLHSPVASSFSSTYGTATINGQDWIGYQGSNGISRDQYSGVFYGLSIAWELVPDPVVRAECQLRLEQMLDYLISKDWIVDEDRPRIPVSRGPTFWAGNSIQRVTFPLIGYRINPTKYAAVVAEAGALSEMAWFGAWTSVLGYDHYYKYNLSHLANYNYFRLDTDPQRWQDFNRAYRITRRYVGHHRNPHFDLIDTTVDASTSNVYFPQSREIMRRFLRRNHRDVAPPVVDLTGVTWVQHTATGYQNGQGSAFSVGATTTTIPSEPLDIELRKYTGHFQWQRDPFSPAVANRGSDRVEKHGLDAVLPYWMGRHIGAF